MQCALNALFLVFYQSQLLVRLSDDIDLDIVL